MKTRKSSPLARSPKTSRLISTLLVLVLGLSCHSCADLPSGRELAAAGVELQGFAKELGRAVRERANTPDTPHEPGAGHADFVEGSERDDVLLGQSLAVMALALKTRPDIHRFFLRF